MTDVDQIFRQQTSIAAPLEKVFAFFGDAKNLEAITPPWLQFHIVAQTTSVIQSGTILTYRLKIHGIPFRWKTLIEEWVPNSHFVDIQLTGPYRKWHHTHRFTSTPQGTLVNDTVAYQVPMGKLGQWVAGNWIRQDVEKIFAYREKKITSIFEPGKR